MPGGRGPRRRRRGVVLTQSGLKKFLTAKAEAEQVENAGRRYTLEDLSERTQLAVDTLMKVQGGELGVDKQTLRTCFRSFDLTLEPGDSDFPGSKVGQDIDDWGDDVDVSTDPPLPDGQVSLDSQFYVERFSPKSECFKAMLRPGSLVRIKGARRMGKTSLTARMAAYAAKCNCRPVSLSLQLAEHQILQDLDRFLQWFCARVGLGIGVLPQFETDWDAHLFGSKVSCTIYFEQYLLPALQQPLVLVLDDVDRLFEYPELADDFFGLLRTWHEEAKNNEVWQKLRLIVAHTVDVYIPLNVNKSPFNVGLAIELEEFTLEQVEKLAHCYGFSWPAAKLQPLIQCLGGHPYLMQLALYHIWHKDTTLEDLIHPNEKVPDIFLEHLQRHLWALQQKPNLALSFAKVISQDTPVELPLPDASQLQGLGLIKLQGNKARPYCPLYEQYFRQQMPLPLV